MIEGDQPTASGTLRDAERECATEEELISAFANPWVAQESISAQDTRQRSQGSQALFQAQHTHDDSGQFLHNASLLSQIQDCKSEYHSAKGRARWIPKTRVPLVYDAPEDADGFFIGAVYQYRNMNDSSQRLDNSNQIMDALQKLKNDEDSVTLVVGYCFILELRKRVGKSLQLRGSMHRKDAGAGEAIVKLLIRCSDTEHKYAGEASIQIQEGLPLSELGSRVAFEYNNESQVYTINNNIATLQDQYQLEQFNIYRTDILCRHLKTTCEKETFLDMTVKELKEELEARDLPISGTKPGLRQRLLADLLQKKRLRTART